VVLRIIAPYETQPPLLDAGVTEVVQAVFGVVLREIPGVRLRFHVVLSQLP
jgi:hypothetical protein